MSENGTIQEDFYYDKGHETLDEIDRLTAKRDALKQQLDRLVEAATDLCTHGWDKHKYWNNLRTILAEIKEK